MLSTEIQSAVSELGKVDILLEMILVHLLNDPKRTKEKEWFIKLENALYLLEETYTEKKIALVSAVRGREENVR